MSTTELGYRPTFLGPPVPLPGAARAVHELPSTHFTVLLDPARRLAAATAVNIDGTRLVDVPRGDDWHLDPRVPPNEQAGPELYAGNDLDRGHLVRRRDPVWGPAAALANQQTFAYPNAAPQASAFNQGERLWVGLENHVLTYASTYRLRLSVFTGPVLADDDPVYRGIGIPRMFWKVAAWATEGTDLRAAGFALDQSALISNLAFAADVPPLGPFLTYQVPVADVEALTGLDLGPLVEADVLAPVTSQDRHGRWVELNGPADIALD
ncbi:DNA/RNA non-specific endonuclease [Cellulomonas sp. URHE0023]|uniref:DNA/RNA non-specific endonuclease n=1 Tax=Cellulomonas sp. URHE0023 TaxID=1380354 RepID=UPI000ACC499C|nr:DNA/RNA non-specific endonuclease [Cellulomonas sp. URHE0023]